MSLRPRERTIGIVAAVAVAAALLELATASSGQDGVAKPTITRVGADPAQAARGRQLYVEGCSSCHGMDARGVEDQGPSLVGAGAAAADFYLRTGRMPLSQPGQQPERAQPAYPDDQIRAIDAYVGSLGGPPIPAVDPAAGSISRGMELFGSDCAGCHSITGEGGVVIGAFAPQLHDATATQVAEAVRVGPYVMPSFDRNQISDADLNSIARYVSEGVQHPDDRGGWGIGHVGPVPEGLVAWAVAVAVLLLVARLVGTRSEGVGPDSSSGPPKQSGGNGG
ncbi:MAG TPA: c-type cytochrome [Solirubrobacterales bacterium]|nr:c-type cytochrome [Solirubrobacterales bacterium]